MRPMRKKRPDPVLMGEPSPSLGRINKMNMEQLRERIVVLETEAARITTRIKNLSHVQPVDESRIKILQEQIERLEVLAKAAKERLEGKAERSRRFEEGGGRPRFNRR
jgi:chromosome segregation ATPase